VEARALVFHRTLCPEIIPYLYYTDQDMYLNVLEDLSSYDILRKKLIARQRHTGLGKQIGRYLGRVLGYTSVFSLDSRLKRWNMASFVNPDLCRITEELVLTNPYRPDGWGNRAEALARPEVRALHNDQELKLRLAELREAFMTNTQALLHGDLHSGSIMVDETDCKVIDLEFATYGPIGFDLGNVIGSLLLNWAAQEGLSDDPDERETHRAYLLQTAVDVWNSFEGELEILWQKSDQVNWPPAYRRSYLKKVWRDTAGYAGTEILRRVLGLGYVADLASIPDARRRAAADALAIRLAVHLIKEPGHGVYCLKDLLARALSEQILS